MEMNRWRKAGIDPRVRMQEVADQFKAAARREASAVREAARSAREEANKRDEELLTVRALFEAWIRDGVRRKDDNAALISSFNARILPTIGAIAVRELNEHELRSLLRGIVARGANRTAVVVRKSLTQMFRWAEKRQPWRKLLADGNPMDLIEIAKIVDRDYDLHNQRDRILSVEEIGELATVFRRVRAEYEAAPNRRVVPQPIERTTELAVWIMLATMCRVGEMSMARWEDVDLDNERWHIPKENVKGNLADFDVWLSPFAADLFRQLYELTGYTEWCFPARNKTTHLEVKAIAKQIGDRQMKFKHSHDGSERKPMKHRAYGNLLVLGGGKKGAWTPHDLRRTGATMMQGLGVPLEVIDRCQNHVLAGSRVRRHYLHHDYATEKRAAWCLLGERLQAILGGQS